MSYDDSRLNDELYEVVNGRTDRERLPMSVNSVMRRVPTDGRKLGRIFTDDKRVLGQVVGEMLFQASA